MCAEHWERERERETGRQYLKSFYFITVCLFINYAVYSQLYCTVLSVRKLSNSNTMILQRQLRALRRAEVCSESLHCMKWTTTIRYVLHSPVYQLYENYSAPYVTIITFCIDDNWHLLYSVSTYRIWEHAILPAQIEVEVDIHLNVFQQATMSSIIEASVRRLSMLLSIHTHYSMWSFGVREKVCVSREAF